MPFVLLALFFDSIMPILEFRHKIRQRVGDPAKDLIEQRSEKAERRFLEFIAATVEEERENEVFVSKAEGFLDILESVP